MIELTDIRSLSDFQRHTKEHLRHIKRSGPPLVLTVNGKAEVVVQNAKAYQKLPARWRRQLLKKAQAVKTFPDRCHKAPEAKTLGEEVRHLIAST